MLRIVRLIPAVLFAAGLFAADLNEELRSASRKGALQIVKQLIEKGATIETKTAYGQTPLYLAAMNGHEEVVRFLLEKGASPQITDTFYNMPMIVFAVSRQHFNIAKLLLQKGATVPDQMIAELFASGNLDLVQTILDKSKPSLAVIDDAYQNALQRKQVEVAALLKKAGGKEPTPGTQVDLKVLESYVGVYKSPSIPLAIKAFVKDGVLYMQATGQGEFPLKPKNAKVLEFSPAQIVVEFSSDSSFTIKQGGRSDVFKKEVTQ